MFSIVAARRSAGVYKTLLVVIDKASVSGASILASMSVKDSIGIHNGALIATELP